MNEVWFVHWVRLGERELTKCMECGGPTDVVREHPSQTAMCESCREDARHAELQAIDDAWFEQSFYEEEALA